MRTREDNRERTKRRILEVALALFREKGFRETTMRDIADGAGIALGTTYNYFPTKEHIALFFFEQSLARVLARHRREVPAGTSLEESAFLLISIELEEIAPYEEFLNLIVAQAMVPSSPLHPFSLGVERLKARHLDYVAGMLQEAMARGELPSFDYEPMMLSAFWVFQLGVLMFWLNDASPNREDTYVLLDNSLRFILGALRKEGRLDAAEGSVG